MREQDSIEQAATTQGAADNGYNLSGGLPIEVPGTQTDDKGQPVIVTPPSPPGG
jgi:hypothetical protein